MSTPTAPDMIAPTHEQFAAVTAPRTRETGAPAAEENAAASRDRGIRADLAPAAWPAHYRATINPILRIACDLLDGPLEQAREHRNAARALGLAGVAEELDDVLCNVRDQLGFAMWGTGPLNPEEFEIDGEPEVPSPERMARHWREQLAHRRRRVAYEHDLYDLDVAWLDRRIQEALKAGDEAMVTALRNVRAEAYPANPAERRDHLAGGPATAFRPVRLWRVDELPEPEDYGDSCEHRSLYAEVDVAPGRALRLRAMVSRTVGHDGAPFGAPLYSLDFFPEITPNNRDTKTAGFDLSLSPPEFEAFSALAQSLVARARQEGLLPAGDPAPAGPAVAEADDAAQRPAPLMAAGPRIELDVRPAQDARGTLQRPMAAAVAAVDYTVHRATAYAEVSASNGAEVSIGRSHDEGTPDEPEGPGPLLLDLKARGFRFVGELPHGSGAAFECDDPNAVLSLAAALQGAIVEAERVGVLPADARAPGSVP